VTVAVNLYDLRGRRVATTHPRRLAVSGPQTVSWVPPELPGGAYLVRVRSSAGGEDTGKLVIVR
jgi:hypothetical protein